MNDKHIPAHVQRYLEELIGCAVQLSTILDHMYLNHNPDPSIPPPAEVLRDLVGVPLGEELEGRKQDIRVAASIVRATSETIEREIYLVAPETEQGPHLN
jgi:hypothetical protein